MIFTLSDFLRLKTNRISLDKAKDSLYALKVEDPGSRRGVPQSCQLSLSRVYPLARGMALGY